VMSLHSYLLNHLQDFLLCFTSPSLLLHQVDGCVTFYRRSKFIMVENYAIEFNDSAREAAASQGTRV
jgi:hypothetical protein